MIQIKQKEDCCGCNACGDVCPKAAIKFSTDEEGFWYPVVDRDKCVNCGLCEKVCPVLNVQELKHNDFEKPICYAAENKNLEVVFDSTSGGLFSALADYMYQKGGYVGGAVFNDDFSVSQFISNNEEDLVRLRSSKYVQSDAQNFYRSIKKLLMSNEKVLVCGTPCQMAALRAFLGRDYENLLMVDFVCLGINSPLVWQKYLDSFQERYGSKVVYAKAKSKEYGWRNLTQKIVLEDGQEIFETKDVSAFTQGYIRTHLYARPSCYECKFKGFPRIADISLADFWGIEKYNTDMEKNLGTSMVLLNSNKGKSYFENIKNKINFIEMPFETILPGNQALVKPLSAYNLNRRAFFDDIKRLPFQEVIEKYSTKHETVGRKIKNILRQYLKRVKRIGAIIKSIIAITKLSPKAIYQTLRYSGIVNLIHRRGIIFSKYCVVNISKTAKLELKALLILGAKGRFPNSHLETRLLVADNAKLSVLGSFRIEYGADIEVHEGGELILHGKKFISSGSNIGLTIVCKEKIEIGNDVAIGRNVLIRDNNGGHYVNTNHYENSRPIVIGEKAWLCESCIIMPGVKIGTGAIISADSFVVSNVPAHAVVSGVPAMIIARNILWKY